LGPSEFPRLFLQPAQWLDVRAPVEFKNGSIPGAMNIPLLNDEERHQIGIEYKNKGQQAAIELGHRLVNGPLRRERTEAWVRFIADHASPIIYCFRGGLRSQIVQAWLKEEGLEVPIVEGGYKALRRFLLNALEERLTHIQFTLVCGPTGSGKSRYLRHQGKAYLDLEALARHRGSAFGALPIAQPNQTDFENTLAIELLRLAETGQAVLVEDESHLIGRVSLPKALLEKMRSSPRLKLEVPLEERVENIFQDYILNSTLGAGADLSRFDHFSGAVKAISRRLGGLRAKEALEDIENSRREFENTGDLNSNRVWIRKLLIWYYDPLYEHSSNKS
jgi:tRNA 2-selenouridine synthase